MLPSTRVAPIRRTAGKPGGAAQGRGGEVRGDIVALRPSDGVEYLPATKPGWNLIATSLVNQIPVAELGGVLAQHSLNLAGESHLQRQTCARYLDGGVEAYRSGVEQGGLSADQIEFFDLVDSQVSNAHRGVFLWNNRILRRH